MNHVNILFKLSSFICYHFLPGQRSGKINTKASSFHIHSGETHNISHLTEYLFNLLVFSVPLIIGRGFRAKTAPYTPRGDSPPPPPRPSNPYRGLPGKTRYISHDNTHENMKVSYSNTGCLGYIEAYGICIDAVNTGK